jgi:hypothetical protein
VTYFRYRLRVGSGVGENLPDSFATRDLGQAECVATSVQRPSTTVYLVDCGAFPSALVGAATKGQWRGILGTCKACKGAVGKKGGFVCVACSGFGVRIEPEPWRAG